jgi:hypothetical protein
LRRKCLEEYLGHGFRKIVVLDHDHSETASGHEEWTQETAVARKGHKFVRVSLREHLRFLGGPGAGISIDSKEISEREYKALAAHSATSFFGDTAILPICQPQSGPYAHLKATAAVSAISY